jgi:hypothetical protein
MKVNMMMYINKKMKNIAIIAVFILFISNILSIAQTNKPPQGTPPATPADLQPAPPPNNPVVQPPLELPTFIIEGVEQLNIKSGMKQFPSPPTVLSGKELDSINPIEKQQSLLVAPPHLPKGQIIPKFANGFIQAKAGMYATFDLLAAYGAKYNGYELYGKGGMATSSGDVKNSDFGKFFVNINSDYIAPEIFWIFGGSRTRTKLNYSNSSFSQYGTLANLARKSNSFDVSLISDGNYEGVNFSTGGGFSSFSMDQKVNGIEETRISAFLNMNTFVDNNLYGLTADLNFGTFQGNSMNLLNLSGDASVYRDKVTIEGETGFQIANSSDDKSQSSFMLAANVSYLPNSDYSIRAEFFTGLEKSFFIDHFNRNVYVDDLNSTFYFPKANAIIRGTFQYFPHTQLGSTLSIAFKFYDKYPFFNSSDSNAIELLFEQANIIAMKAEGFYEINTKDKLNGFAAFNLGTLDNGKTIPYLPAIEASLAYERNWTGKFSSELGLVFNSKRYTDKDNKNSINSYVNLFTKVNYKITDKLKITAELQNLTNNDNFIWKNYKERGVFGSIGINWQY